jgi:hypothetical protein
LVDIHYVWKQFWIVNILRFIFRGCKIVANRANGIWTLLIDLFSQLIKKYVVTRTFLILYWEVNFSCPVIENFIWIETLLWGHLSYKATFSVTHRWPLNTGPHKRVSIHMKFSITGQEKLTSQYRWLLNRMFGCMSYSVL